MGFTLLRGAAIGGLSLVSGHMINLWFDRYRGRANAISMMGLALGGLVVPGVAEQLAQTYGWRDAYLALGAAVVVAMLPLGLIFFRNRPQTYGLLPDFGTAASAKETFEIPRHVSSRGVPDNDVLVSAGHRYPSQRGWHGTAA